MLPEPAAPLTETSSSGPTQLRLPNPDAAASYQQGMGLLAFAGMVAGTFVFLFTVIAGGNWLWLGLGALVGLPVAVIGVAWLAGQRIKHPMTVRRCASSVLNLPGGPLPAGSGRVIVERQERQTGRSTYWVYALRFEAPEVQRELFHRCRNASVVRECAEGLCRLGGWEMVWRSPEGEEVRTPDELDLPIAERLRRRPEEGAPEGASPLVSITQRNGFTEIGSSHRPLRFWIVFLAWNWGMAGYFWHDLSSKHPDSPLVYLVVAWPLLLSAWFLFDELAIRQRILASPDGLRLRTTVLGATWREIELPAQQIESLYVERRGFAFQVMIAGDGFHRRGGRFGEAADAILVRRKIIDALQGGQG